MERERERQTHAWSRTGRLRRWRVSSWSVRIHTHARTHTHTRERERERERNTRLISHEEIVAMTGIILEFSHDGKLLLQPVYCVIVFENNPVPFHQLVHPLVKLPREMLKLLMPVYQNLVHLLIPRRETQAQAQTVSASEAQMGTGKIPLTSFTTSVQ